MILWYYNIDDFPDNQVQIVLSNLPAFIAEEIKKYKLIEDQKSRLISRLMLQKIAEELDCNWSWSLWKRSKNNKPYFDNGPFFNISHSGKIVVISVSTESHVGIDVEIIKNIDVVGLTNNFHQDEISHLRMNNFSLVEFYKIWTRKEALLKAIGIGFLEGLSTFSVVKDIIYDHITWYLYEIEIFEEPYLCHLCTSKPILNIQLKKLDYNTLNNFINEKILY